MGHSKKHHYVPQFILRNFATEGRTRLYVFDKQTDRVFPANVADVAAENRLYEFSLGDLTATIEPSLADFESKAASVLREVLGSNNLAGLTLYQRILLSGLVAQLLVRSPQQRSAMRHLTAELRQRISAMGTDPDLVPQLKVFDDNEEKLFTAHSLPNLMKQFIPVIAEKAWILHSVPEDETLYISDNPVAMHNERQFGLRGNLGLSVEGVEVYLPLGRRRCLGMYCHAVTSELVAAYDAYGRTDATGRQPLPPALPEEATRFFGAFKTGECSPLPKVSIQFVNSLQVWNAERYVYSGSDDFELAHEMVAKNPSLRTGPRPQAG
ncbi:MAG: DUF4238 domain-containing protein [Deltaproteobacteria bacterium]|nr:DUF4238 domain-containing protein [Deltaproteobacteria bacterium]